MQWLLKCIKLENNELSDEPADKILEWIFDSFFEKSTLEKIHLGGNALTQIPPRLQQFPNLWKINLNNQREPGFGVISTFDIFNNQNSLKITLSFSASHITRIAPCAFQGLIIY